jgi:hypothetical protein
MDNQRFAAGTIRLGIGRFGPGNRRVSLGSHCIGLGNRCIGLGHNAHYAPPGSSRGAAARSDGSGSNSED